LAIGKSTDGFKSAIEEDSEPLVKFDEINP